MRAQAERARIGRVELLHQLGPQQAAGAQLRHLHEKVHADPPEEGEARRKFVDREPGCESRARIFDAVGERVSEFEVMRRARLLHVIAGDRD